ncbi:MULTISPECIES: hypothetical protein [unclassified Lysobacter]
MQTTERNGPASYRLRPLVLVGLLLLAPFASAQDATRIEQQMTAEQFQAAGLDQLTPAQLSQLNNWLNRTLDTETSKATKVAEERIEQEQRGFAANLASEPVIAHLQGKFEGFREGLKYTLDNGQVWRQTNNASLVGVRLDSPQVTITPGMFGGIWYLRVEGYNTRAKVERVE